MDAERARELHARLGALLADAPAFGANQPLDQGALQWLGRVEAILDACQRLPALLDFRAARRALNTLMHDSPQLFGPIYTVMAALELEFAPDTTPTFLPAGSPFDAFVAVSQVLQRAENNLLVVDRYLDATILARYFGGLRSDATIRLMTAYPRTRHTESLLEAGRLWNTQHPERVAEVRIAAQGSIHDRLILVDGREAWTSTQSFKDIADRSPAELVNALGIAGDKIEAYEDLWTVAEQALP